MKFFNKYLFIGIGLGFLITILLEVGLFGILIYTVSKGQHMESMLDAPEFPAATDADYHWSVKSLDGKMLDMNQLKGKVVFLNFWATWCPPCRAEMPGIQSLYDKIKKEDVVFVCVSQEDDKTVAKFILDKKYTFPIYTLQGSLPSIYETQGIPATFIISRNGKVSLKHVGSAKWDDPKCIDFIKGLLEKNS